MSPLCVLWIEAVPEALRGSITRWMLEPVAGMFIGRPSAKVRDALWRLVEKHVVDGRAVLVVTDQSEFGAKVKTVGESRRTMLDLDGLELVAFL